MQSSSHLTLDVCLWSDIFIQTVCLDKVLTCVCDIHLKSKIIFKKKLLNSSPTSPQMFLQILI